MLKLRALALHLFMLRVCAWLCTKGYMPCRQGLCKRLFAERPGNRASWVKLTKMFDVPEVAHWDTIFGLQADCAGPGDSYYPIRAFPLWRQLVGILGRLNAPKNKVAFLKTSGVNLAAMVAARPAGSVQLAQPPEDYLPQGASRHLAATALAQARQKRALEVTRM